MKLWIECAVILAVALASTLVLAYGFDIESLSLNKVNAAGQALLEDNQSFDPENEIQDTPIDAEVVLKLLDADSVQLDDAQPVVGYKIQGQPVALPISVLATNDYSVLHHNFFETPIVVVYWEHLKQPRVFRRKDKDDDVQWSFMETPKGPRLVRNEKRFALTDNLPGLEPLESKSMTWGEWRKASPKSLVIHCNFESDLAQNEMPFRRELTPTFTCQVPAQWNVFQKDGIVHIAEPNGIQIAIASENATKIKSASDLLTAELKHMSGITQRTKATIMIENLQGQRATGTHSNDVGVWEALDLRGTNDRFLIVAHGNKAQFSKSGQIVRWVTESIVEP